MRNAETLDRILRGGRNVELFLDGPKSLAGRKMARCVLDWENMLIRSATMKAIAFDGDPLRQTGVAARVVFVMKGGKVFENLASGAKDLA